MEEPDPGTKNAVHTDCPGQPSQPPPQENSGMDSVTRWGIDWWGTIAINDPIKEIFDFISVQASATMFYVAL